MGSKVPTPPPGEPDKYKEKRMFGSDKAKVTTQDNDKNPNLNKIAKDKISGFTGVVTGFCQYITGCDTYLLTPKCEEASKYPEGHWFDINRLEFISDKSVDVDTSVDAGPCERAPLY
jgi:hypothetical protein